MSSGAAGVGWRRLIVESPRPRAIANHPRAHWFAVGAVSVGAFMGQLDASVVSLAFPTLRHHFDASVSAVQWVGLSYLFVLVVLLAPLGRLSDVAGRKLLYVNGFVVFVIGSVLCGVAPTLWSLDVFRAVQAIGAAMLQANSVAIIATTMPRGQLGRGIGVQGAAQALGLALGPAVGGLLISVAGWRLVFLLNVPVGLLGIVAAWLLVPRSRNLVPRGRLDAAGFALFVPTLAALLVALSFGNQLGWLSPSMIGLTIVAFVGAVAFVRCEQRAQSPMIDLRLFGSADFTTGIASGLLAYSVLFGSLFVAPFFLEAARGLSPGQTGLVLMALPAALALTAPVAGRRADLVGARRFTLSGMLVTACALVLLALVRSSSIGVLVADFALLGVGLGLFIPVNNAAIMGAAPIEASGMAGGVVNMSRGLGTTFGLAVTALIFGAVAGQHASAARSSSGFEACVLVLAGLATAAAVICGTTVHSAARSSRRPPRPSG